MEQGSFLDSGTTLFYSHPKIHDAITKAFSSYCSTSGNCKGAVGRADCFMKNGDDPEFYKSFPPLYFQLDDNLVFTWQPEDYLITDDNSKYCLPFQTI
jgi:hypothetical protein